MDGPSNPSMHAKINERNQQIGWFRFFNGFSNLSNFCQFELHILGYLQILRYLHFQDGNNGESFPCFTILRALARLLTVWILCEPKHLYLSQIIRTKVSNWQFPNVRPLELNFSRLISLMPTKIIGGHWV